MNRDQFSYSAADLFRHVGCLWDSEYVTKSKDPSEIRAPADPARTPDLPLIVADIKRAWGKAPLDATERQIFVCRAFWELPLENIGALYDLTETQVADVLDVVVAEIVQALNGGTR
ncbi:MAG TPA: hypothetical protein VFM86_09715 [Pedococcus sp.]|nr:hypothetical protein [Pedococcus sp.]